MADRFLSADYFKDGSDIRFSFTSALRKKLMHSNEFWELLYIYEGHGELYINNISEPVNAGDVVLLKPDIDYMLISPPKKSESPARLCRCIFKREYMDALCGAYMDIFASHDFRLPMMLFSSKTVCVHIRDDDAGNIHRLLWLMAHEYHHPNTGSETIVRSSMLNLLICVTRLYEYHIKNVPPTLRTVAIFEKLKKYISDNFGSDLTLESLAGYVHVSREHLSRSFKQYAGQTISDYLLDVRMTRAKQMLVHSKHSVTDISAYCGYKTIGSFQRAFKKYTGISPSEYRKGKYRS